MLVYSKSGKKWGHDYVFTEYNKLTDVNLNDDNITYYHHPYDSLMENIPLHNAVNGANWQHIKNNPTVRLMHDNNSETFDISFVNDVVKTIKMHEIDPAQLTLIVMDENHRDYLIRMLKTHEIEGVDIQVYNYLLTEVALPQYELSPTKLFSSLSRNYRNWRLRLYVELLEKGILENNFIYSFFNIWPYCNPPKTFSKSIMLEDLKKIGFTNITKDVKRWLKQCPHELPTDTIVNSTDVLNKWSNITYDAIQSSNIHIIIETHYDQKGYSEETMYDRDFAPSSITEKAYKAIACRRPFIAFSTPFWLQDLRNLGFKTFSGIIDESYDRATDNSVRLNMIVNEIERISKLPADELNQLVTACQEIADYNYNKLVEKQNAR
jgi:hypothetical protein